MGNEWSLSQVETSLNFPPVPNEIQALLHVKFHCENNGLVLNHIHFSKATTHQAFCGINRLRKYTYDNAYIFIDLILLNIEI